MSSCSPKESHPLSDTVCHNPSILQFRITKILNLVGQMRVTVPPARVLGQKYVILLSVEVVSASQYITISSIQRVAFNLI